MYVIVSKHTLDTSIATISQKNS